MLKEKIVRRFKRINERKKIQLEKCCSNGKSCNITSRKG